MGIAGMVNETFDRIILKHLVVVPDSILDKSMYLMHELGVYGANYKLSIFMSLFIQAYRYAAEPVFFSLSGEQDAKVQYAHVMNYFFAFVVFIFLLITLYIDFFKHFISSSYHAGLVVVPILLAANLCLGLIYNLSIWYKVIDKTKFGMYTGLFGAGLTIVLNFLLIPSMGYLGAAWATLICYFLMLCVSYFLSRIYYRIDYNFRKLGLLFLSGSLVYLFDFFLRSTDLSFVVSSVLRTFAFFGYLFVALFVLDLNRRLKWKLKL
jgi:O-antigen/teichoic acid export membrane protein